jgi:hypothetical protein
MDEKRAILRRNKDGVRRIAETSKRKEKPNNERRDRAAPSVQN